MVVALVAGGWQRDSRRFPACFGLDRWTPCISKFWKQQIIVAMLLLIIVCPASFKQFSVIVLWEKARTATWRHTDTTNYKDDFFFCTRRRCPSNIAFYMKRVLFQHLTWKCIWLFPTSFSCIKRVLTFGVGQTFCRETWWRLLRNDLNSWHRDLSFWR